MSPLPQRLAAIDVGSNTILLLIAEHLQSTGLTAVLEAEDQPRLGAGVSRTGQLNDHAIEQALQGLTRMRELCRQHRVERIAAVATAAVREAGNGEEFALKVRGMGIPLRILSPKEEAALAYRSAAHYFPADGRTLVADIGGGSLELVGAHDGRIELTESLPLGAVRLAELSLPLGELRARIGAQLGRVISGPEWTGSRVIGSGGTFATLGSMLLAGRETSPGQRVHGAVVSRSELGALLTYLAGMSPDQRRSVPGLQPGRADIIVPGLAVAAELLERIEAEGVTVSERGLRWGLLLELIEGA